MYDKHGETNYTLFTYENGLLIKRYIKHAKSTTEVTRYFDYEVDLYKYDENRNVIERKEILKRKESKKEIIQEHIRYQYDSIGNCIMEETIDISGYVIERKNNKYNHRKLAETISWQLFEGEDLYQKDIYKYNADSLIASHTHIIYMYGSNIEEEDKWIENYLYEYNDNGALIKETKIIVRDNKQIKTNTTIYTDFDEFNNWKHKSMGEIIVIRKIEYY